MPTLTFLQMSDLHLDSVLQSGRLALPEGGARVRREGLWQIVPRVLCWDLAMTNATDEEWITTSEVPLIKELLETAWPE